MPRKNEAKKGVPSRAGDRKHKFAGFFAATLDRKIRHVLRDHGKAAAEKWAEDHDARLAFLRVTKG